MRSVCNTAVKYSLLMSKKLIFILGHLNCYCFPWQTWDIWCECDFSHLFVIVIGNDWRINLLNTFHRTLTGLSSYLDKLCTFGIILILLVFLGKVTKQLWCGAKCFNRFMWQSFLITTTNEWLKSVSRWQSYCKSNRGLASFHSLTIISNSPNLVRYGHYAV